MRYWWVNQNQTYRHEIGGGYLWSPKRNANGARNPYYESMREVAPGDLIFSFVDTRIFAIGTAQSWPNLPPGRYRLLANFESRHAMTSAAVYPTAASSQFDSKLAGGVSPSM